MCGRYTLRRIELIQRAIDAVPLPAFEEFAEQVPPLFNIAPTQFIPIVRLNSDGRRVLDVARWGLVPSWAKDPAIGNRMINARAETAPEKPAFRDAFRRRRCLIPADGFYEWQQQQQRRRTPADAAKVPHFIRMKNERVFFFAGLWERWKDHDDEQQQQHPPAALETCTILTTSPNELMAPIHDRMPVIIAQADFELWLDPGSKAEAVEQLLRPFPASDMEAFPVSTRVNNPRNDGPELLDPVET